MMPLIVRQAFVDWSGGRGIWLRRGIVVGACMTVAIQVPDLFILATPPRWKVSRKWTELFGWRDMARQVEAISPGDPVFCSMYETAAEMSFYMKGQPDAFVSGADRPSASDDFPDRLDLTTLDELVYIGAASDHVQSPPEIVAAGFHKYPRMGIDNKGIDIRIEHDGHLLQERRALVAQRGSYAPPTSTTQAAP
jgi:hypothetical protein